MCGNLGVTTTKGKQVIRTLDRLSTFQLEDGDIMLVGTDEISFDHTIMTDHGDVVYGLDQWGEMVSFFVKNHQQVTVVVHEANEFDD